MFEGYAVVLGGCAFCGRGCWCGFTAFSVVRNLCLGVALFVRVSHSSHPGSVCLSFRSWRHAGGVAVLAEFLLCFPSTVASCLVIILTSQALQVDMLTASAG